MTDIVKALRAIDHMSVEDCFLQSPMFEKAADEIDRLREALRSLIEWRENAQIYAGGGQVLTPEFIAARAALEGPHQLRAENARLREALVRIVEEPMTGEVPRKIALAGLERRDD